MTPIGRGVKARDRCRSTDYHTNLSIGNAVICRSAMWKMLATTPENVLDYFGLGVTKSIRFWGTYAR